MSYLLSVDGCPYSFGSDGCSSLVGVTSDDAEFSHVDDSTLVQGVLEVPSGWSEEISPSDGELRVSGMTFLLRDIPVQGVGWLLTYLSTRSAENVTSAKLIANLTSSGTTISVDDVTKLPNVPTTVWIDREAIYCDARDTGADTLTVATGGRGDYNSRANSHVISTSDSIVNEVYGSFPWMAKRRVCLWLIRSDSTAIPLWRGYAQRAPRMTASGDFELQCDHIWTVISQEKPGISESRTVLHRFEAKTIQLTVKVNETTFGATTQRQWNSSTITNAIYGDLITAVHSHCDASYNHAFVSTTGFIDVANSTNGLRISATSSYEQIELSAIIGSRQATGTSTEPQDPRQAIVEFQNPPTALVFVSFVTSKDYPVSSTQGFPSTWTGGLTTDGAHTTSVRYVLLGETNDVAFELRPTAHSDSANTVTASAAYRQNPKRGTNTQVMAVICESPTPVHLGTVVTSTHWIWALYRGVIANTAYGRQFDSRDWDWTNNQRAIASSNGELAAVKWTFEGKHTVGEIVSESCKLTGISLSVRDSKLAFVSMAPPLQNTTASASYSLDSASVIKHPPQWARWGEQFCNTVELEVEEAELKITVVDQRSQARYGSTVAKKIKLIGHPERLNDADFPEAVRNTLLSAYLNRYAYDLFMVVCCVKITDIGEVFIGDYVSITSSRLPDGSGNRGVSSRVMQVFGRRTSLQKDGYIELKLIDWQKPYRVGIAPAIRVSGISGAVVTAAADYVYASGSSTTTDYAGSDQTGYAKTNNDYGVGWFVAGDKVQLVQIDATSPATPASFTILSVNTATREITLTSSPAGSWATLISGGSLVDLIPDVYGTAVTAQKLFGYVGAVATEVIAGTADLAKRWS